MSARPLAVVVLAVLLASLLPVSAAAPTPGLGCRPAEAGAPALRIVPEPEYALDYISFDEWRTCLSLIEKAAPGYVNVIEVAKSVGWNQVGGMGRLQLPVYWVEVTNEASPIPFEHRLKNLFVLSIHGNEKGGREGGFRVIEDLARGIGIAQEYPNLRKYLDYQVAIFVFANPDGWSHEELPAFAANPGVGGFTRENANRVDLNRQWPNHGWSDTNRRSMSQPEIVGVAKMIKNYTNWFGGSDIHGMLTPSDGRPQENVAAVQQGRQPKPGGSLLMGMLSAGQSDPLKMLKTTRLAELLKDRVDKDTLLSEWSRAPETGLWGGEVMHWGTSWDTIGYVDSGFTGDFIFQPHGMDAVDIDFELSYNHIVTDNHYAGPGMELNRLHVRAVRQTVAVFMDAAAADVQMSYETKGARTAYLYNPKVVSNRDGIGTDVLTGWAAENPHDDQFDHAHVDYRASPNDYFDHVRPFVREGDKPGVLEAVMADAITAETLARFDNFVVAGSAVEQLEGRTDKVQLLAAWTRNGGNLVLTDAALRLTEPMGALAAGSVSVTTGYAGYTNFVDRAGPLTKGLRGLARQTYEALPVGYEPGGAPNHFVERPAWEAIGGKTVGAIPSGTGQAGALAGTNLGEAPFGKGKIRILGSLLPDPTEEHYHPYGLDSYATTYTGNLLFRNLLGWEETFQAAPLVVESLGKAKMINTTADAGNGETKVETPATGPVVACGTVIALAWALRRRTR